MTQKKNIRTNINEEINTFDMISKQMLKQYIFRKKKRRRYVQKKNQSTADGTMLKVSLAS